MLSRRPNMMQAMPIRIKRNGRFVPPEKIPQLFKHMQKTKVEKEKRNNYIRTFDGRLIKRYHKSKSEMQLHKLRVELQHLKNPNRTAYMNRRFRRLRVKHYNLQVKEQAKKASTTVKKKPRISKQDEQYAKQLKLFEQPQTLTIQEARKLGNQFSFDNCSRLKGSRSVLNSRALKTYDSYYSLHNTVSRAKCYGNRCSQNNMKKFQSTKSLPVVSSYKNFVNNLNKSHTTVKFQSYDYGNYFSLRNTMKIMDRYYNVLLKKHGDKFLSIYRDLLWQILNFERNNDKVISYCEQKMKSCGSKCGFFNQKMSSVDRLNLLADTVANIPHASTCHIRATPSSHSPRTARSIQSVTSDQKTKSNSTSTLATSITPKTFEPNKISEQIINVTHFGDNDSVTNSICAIPSEKSLLRIRDIVSKHDKFVDVLEELKTNVKPSGTSVLEEATAFITDVHLAQCLHLKKNHNELNSEKVINEILAQYQQFASKLDEIAETKSTKPCKSVSFSRDVATVFEIEKV